MNTSACCVDGWIDLDEFDTTLGTFETCWLDLDEEIDRLERMLRDLLAFADESPAAVRVSVAKLRAGTPPTELPCPGAVAVVG